MNSKKKLYRASGLAALFTLTAAAAIAQAQGPSAPLGPDDLLIVTSTNSASGNDIVVFQLEAGGTPSLSLVDMVTTGGKGGASGNAGSVQFNGNRGAVANYGSNSVTQLQRTGHSISVGKAIPLAAGCTKPDSVALTDSHLLVVGANCIESHAWPLGNVDGTVVHITDSSAGQIAAGETWAAVTLGSGSVLQLPLTGNGALTGSSVPVTLPSNANNTPLGAAFWGNLLAFNPAHSPDSFVLMDQNRDLFPVLGPQPAYPTNAPCWLAKGPGNIWYSGNSPGQAVSIFFSDGKGGTFYKSIPLPGTPTDITVSDDNKWLAVIYSAADGSGGRIAVFAIDAFGDLFLAATSSPVGVPAFNGVAISE